jgi:hypothetical protein
MGDKVLAALVAKDWNQLKAMHWAVDDAMATCTDIPEDKKSKAKEEFSEELAESEEHFKSCLKTDWTGAKLTGVTGGDVDDPLKGCGDKAHEVKDIKLAVEVGGKKMEVKVNDPVKVGDAYMLFEGIRCRAPELSCDDIYDHMSKLVGAAADAKERDKEMFSGAADKKASFAKECEEMKGSPMAKGILDCVAAAASYADINACEKQARDAMDKEMAGDKPVEPAPAPAEPAPAPAPTEPAAAPVAPTAPAAGGDMCDKYVTKMSACGEALPEAAREPMKKALEDFKKAIAGQPAEATSAACSAAYDAAKKGLAGMCPAVTWD